MRRSKSDSRLLCYASIIVLSLTACTQHGAKPKNGDHLTENTQPASTPDAKKSGAGHGGKRSQSKDKSLASAGDGQGPSQYDNLWDRLFDLYDLPPIEHADIDREFEWFLNHPDYINRVQKRAEPFLYSIVKQVEKHDIPGEIALLPVIESAFQPHVVSPANAAGIWQFIPSTGRMYGLKQSRSYDGRRDIYASTRAAIKYLKKLHKDFRGDWLLAIAAYNCGEGAVGRAIQRNLARGLPTDFWSLDLPQETRTYVPRLLAVSKLFVEADQRGIDLRHIPNEARFKPVKVNSQIDLALAADAADISLEKLYELNPGFKHQFADINGSYRLFIPAEKKTAEFKEKLARLTGESRILAKAPPLLPETSALVATAPEPDPAAPFAAIQNDPLPSLETLPVAEPEPRVYQEIPTPPPVVFNERRELAREREREKELAWEERQKEKELAREAAREEREAARIAAKERESAREKERELAKEKEKEQRIAHAREREEPAAKSPAKGADKNHDRARPTELAAEDRSGKKVAYMVQPGETLWAVARKHSVDVEQLAKWNNLSEDTHIKTGQTLAMWSKDAGKKLVMVHTGIRPSQSITSKYTVREGDTLFSISRRFKVSVTDLRKWNSNIEKQMQPGRNITVQSDKD